MAALDPLIIDCPARDEVLPLPIHTDKGKVENGQWVMNVSVEPADVEAIAAHFKAHSDALSLA